jgi:cell division transport system ATP-binding protein
MIKQLASFENVNILRGSQVILKNIFFEIHNAEIVFILGDSGNGKSSFLKALYGAIDITGERAELLSNDLLNIKPVALQKLRRKLGLVFQDFKLFNKLNVYNNLDYFLKSIQHNNPNERAKDIQLILEKVGLHQLQTKKPHELSGGEKQRLAIARALIHKPEVILADEPTGNLNKHLGIEIFKLLRTLALENGTSIITATHDESLARLFSAKLYYCENNAITRKD